MRRHYRLIFTVFYPSHKIHSSRHNNILAFEVRYYNANSNKDDIQFVTEFPCFWDTLYISRILLEFCLKTRRKRKWQKKLIILYPLQYRNYRNISKNWHYKMLDPCSCFLISSSLQLKVADLRYFKL